MPTGLHLDDLEANKYDNVADESISSAIIEEFRKDCPSIGALNKTTFTAIINSLRNGVSFGTALLGAGVSADMAYRWLNKGKKDLQNIPEETLQSCDNTDGLLSIEAKFYILVNKAKSDCVIEMHNTLYDRRQEDPHIAQWFLNVLEPETYNLKYRMFKESQEIDSRGLNAEIVFKIENGKSMRPTEDSAKIDKALSELDKQYSGNKVDLSSLSNRIDARNE